MLVELGDTSKLATDLVRSRHLNFHIRQSVARPAAGTLRKHLQQWSFWSEWALECDIHPGKSTQADMADHLHAVVTGARQDRSRVRTSTLSGAIQSVTFVSRKAQVEPLLAILDTPLIGRYLAGDAAPRPRREALPLPLAALVQWERWICSESAPEHEILFNWQPAALGMGRPPLRRCVVASRQTCQEGECWRTKVCRSGQPFGALANGSSGRRPSWGWGHVYVNSLRLPDGGLRRPEPGRRLSCPTNGLLRQASGDGRHTLALQHSTNVPSKSSTSAADAKRSNDARPSPVLHHTLRSLKATVLSIAKRIDAPEHHRAEQGHRRQHGGCASVRLDSRDDVRGCACVPATRCSESDRILTAQGRGAQIPLTEPAVQIDPPTTPEVVTYDFDSSPISQTEATEKRIATSRKPRRSAKLQTPTLTPGNMEELTDASITGRSRTEAHRPGMKVVWSENAMRCMKRNVFRSWLRE